MTRLQQTSFALFVFASFATTPSSCYQTSKDEKESFKSSSLLFSPLPDESTPYDTDESLEGNDRQTLTNRASSMAMVGDSVHERRAATSVSPGEGNELDFFDSLFNSKIEMKNSPLSNRTLVPYRSSNGTVIYTLCHIPAFLNFNANASSPVPSRDGIRGVASALMALHHFNNGDNSVIPQIKQCNVNKFNLRFTMEAIDTRRQPFTVSTILSKMLQRKKHPVDRKKDSNVVQAYPSGIIGAVRSTVTAPLSKLAAASHLVTVSHGSSSDDFSAKGMYPLFARTIPATSADAMAVVSFFREELNATHLGVLHVNDVFGRSYARAIENAARRYNHPILVSSTSFPVDASEDEVKIALGRLKETGYRHFVSIVFEKELQTAMPLAYDMGIASKEYFWMFTEPQLGLKNSPLIGRPDLAQALNGSAIMATSNGRDLLQENPFYDAYMSSFSKLWHNDEGWNYLQSKVPGLNLTMDLIEGSDASMKELFLYEAVVALCLASCAAAETTRFDFYTANELYRSLTKTNFDGVYGPAFFDTRTGDRSVVTVRYAVYNILSTKSTFTVEAKYQQVLKEDDMPEKMVWELLPNKEFIYADGTTTPPDNLPPLQENRNVPSVGIAVFSLVLCGLVLTLSVIFIVWTYKRRSTKVVRASQPIFLYILCTGTFIMSSSMIPTTLLLLDGSEGSLSVACICRPWLVNIGFTVSFSALFSKTRRIYKIMAMSKEHKRVVIRPIDVMIPFFVLLSLQLISLITYTVITPVEYRRYYVESSVDRFGRPDSSYGYCYYDGEGVGTIVLFSLNNLIEFIAIVLSLYYAYRARLISTEYNESQYIAITIFIFFELGLYYLIIGLTSSGNTKIYTIFSLIYLFVVSFTIILLIFGPKVVAVRDERQKELEKEKKKQERLERLRQFDALIKEDKDDVDSNAIESIPPVVHDTEECNSDTFEENNYGVQVIESSKVSAHRKAQVELSNIISENKKLKQSIKSIKDSIRNQ